MLEVVTATELDSRAQILTYPESEHTRNIGKPPVPQKATLGSTSSGSLPKLDYKLKDVITARDSHKPSRTSTHETLSKLNVNTVLPAIHETDRNLVASDYVSLNRASETGQLVGVKASQLLEERVAGVRKTNVKTPNEGAVLTSEGLRYRNMVQRSPDSIPRPYTTDYPVPETTHLPTPTVRLSTSKRGDFEQFPLLSANRGQMESQRSSSARRESSAETNYQELSPMLKLDQTDSSKSAKKLHDAQDYVIRGQQMKTRIDINRLSMLTESSDSIQRRLTAHDHTSLLTASQSEIVLSTREQTYTHPENWTDLINVSHESAVTLSQFFMTFGAGQTAPSPTSVSVNQVVDKLIGDTEPVLQTADIKQTEPVLEKLRTMREILIVFLQRVQRSMFRLNDKHKTQMSLLLKSKVTDAEDTNRDVDALLNTRKENSNLKERLTKCEDFIRQLKGRQLSSKKGDDIRFNRLLESYDKMGSEYKNHQLKIQRMMADYSNAVDLRNSLISELELKKEKFEQLYNLHNHLITQLNNELGNVGVTVGSSHAKERISKDQVDKSIDNVRKSIRSANLVPSVKQVVDALTAHASNLSNKQRYEQFITQYIDLPDKNQTALIESFIITQLPSSRGQTHKDKALQKSLLDLNMSLDQHIEHIYRSIRHVETELTETDQSERKQSLIIPAGGYPSSDHLTSELTPDGRVELKQSMLENVCKLIKDSFLSQSELSGVIDRCRLGPGTVMIGSRCGSRQNTSLAPQPPVWNRENSILAHVNQKDGPQLAVPSPSESLASRIELIDRNSTNFNTCPGLMAPKGPKHQARLEAKRSQTVDKNFCHLPIPKSASSSPDNRSSLLPKPHNYIQARNSTSLSTKTKKNSKLLTASLQANGSSDYFLA